MVEEKLKYFITDTIWILFVFKLSGSDNVGLVFVRIGTAFIPMIPAYFMDCHWRPLEEMQ